MSGSIYSRLRVRALKGAIEPKASVSDDVKVIQEAGMSFRNVQATVGGSTRSIQIFFDDFATG